MTISLLLDSIKIAATNTVLCNLAQLYDKTSLASCLRVDRIFKVTFLNHPRLLKTSLTRHRDHSHLHTVTMNPVAEKVDSFWQRHQDPLLKDYISHSPSFVLTVTLVYLIIIAYGRVFMRDRKQFELSAVLKVFNLTNVFCSSLIVIAYLSKPQLLIDAFTCGTFDGPTWRPVVILVGYYWLKVITS